MLTFPAVGSADHPTVHRDRPAHPSVKLGIHLSRYPELVVIPGMPVLYDPRLSSNYFFYEGRFWVFWDTRRAPPPPPQPPRNDGRPRDDRPPGSPKGPGA